MSKDIALRLFFGFSVAVFASTSLYAMNVRPGPQMGMQVDGPVFTSVEALSYAADTVVEARIIKVVNRLRDFGEPGPSEDIKLDSEASTSSGLPLVIYEAEVIETLTGKAKPGQRILIPLLDEKVIDSDHITILEPDREYIMFLAHRPADTVKGLDTEGEDLFVPLNYNNGILRVDKDAAQLNRWVLGLTEENAQPHIEHLSDVEHHHGPKAAEMELQMQEYAIVSRAEIAQIVAQSR